VQVSFRARNRRLPALAQSLHPAGDASVPRDRPAIFGKLSSTGITANRRQQRFHSVMRAHAAHF